MPSSDQLATLPGAIQLIKSIPIRLPVGLCIGALDPDIESVSLLTNIENFRTIVTAEDAKKANRTVFRRPQKLEIAVKPAKTVAIET